MATTGFHRAAVVFSVIAFVFMFVGFATPYWYQSWKRVHSPFGNIGLWHVCLSGFIMPRDPIMKSYVGCWWIHSTEFSAISMELMPVWFRFIQAFCVFTVIGNLVALILTICYALPGIRDNLMKYPKLIFIDSLILLVCAFLVFLIALIFAEKSNDSSWMPRPWMNHLSWSYGLCVTSGFFSAFGGMCMFILGLIYADKEKNEEPRVTSAAELARKQRELEKQDEAMRSQQQLSTYPIKPQYAPGPPYVDYSDMRRAPSNSSSVNPATSVYRREPHAYPKKPPSDAGSQSTNVNESMV